MSGSKRTRMTLEEMQNAIAARQDESDWEGVRQRIEAGLDPEPDEDSPDATELMRAALQQKRGRPPSLNPKTQIAIRLDRDIVEAFRAGGPGWQTRMNAALREWLAAHPH
ncbi:BrnA antitoxin family protein [Synechococcus elongatus]|uniref:ANL12 n=2 Tax=Synechococcus elongatus TaxID=32046 RepID=Q8KUW1_SYNE7|nr:BrnA antitoxin family protein [Synechococcus elongatus]AJD58965.1 hypothetical protein M744_14190 [Synechococcus elongatus UTEX 2973]MBD2690135.1 BrnA antitoxin family protein [Synechococcus elongatus FACHB-1061]UOW77920.1 hypothetical protein PCC6301pg_B039 [Synechococcus elongatus PCC 6301]AAM81143.1 ANL12 [Synechococcus elongatus PCC 7942 = FACHB-805]ABB58668.1 conserved hypothetical protein [Synechococcus elongatus PCC 7942 = FACHB-805]